MNKKQIFKDKTSGQAHKEEAGDVVITYEGMAWWADIRIINLTEIITPQPYSVFALCKLYEYFQRN
jgi:hypothetical protein